MVLAVTVVEPQKKKKTGIFGVVLCAGRRDGTDAQENVRGLITVQSIYTTIQNTLSLE